MRILSIDGGGMCGIIPVRILERLNLGAEDFDLIAGTSVGGILALALGTGRTPAQVREFFYSAGPRIFHRPLWKRLWNWSGAICSLYDIQALKRELIAVFGEAKLQECEPMTLVVGYNALLQRPKVWKSWTDSEPCWRVATCTSAAPVYFDGYSSFEDGGLTANNPAMCAICEALRMGAALQDIQLLSLGTGYPREHGDGRDKHRGWLLKAQRLLSTMLSAPGQAVDYQCVQMPLGDYTRLDIPLPTRLLEMDDARTQTLRAREAVVDREFRMREIAVPWASA